MKFYSVLISLCLLVFIPSCSKEDDEPFAALGEIKCQINGETRVFFGTVAIELNQNAGARYTYIISGSADGDRFTINIDEDGRIATGDYSAEGEGPTQSREAELIFLDNPGNDEYRSSSSEEGSAAVNITSITPTSVKGTFTGKIALNRNFTGGSVKTITSGSFEAEF